jgi:hypothetical protein
VLGNTYASVPLCYNDTNLATQGKGRFVNRPTTTGGKKYDKYFVYIPTELATDSQFPFKVGSLVRITINTKAKKIILEKA